MFWDGLKISSNRIILRDSAETRFDDFQLSLCR
jgi:hypothetical protein